MDEFDPALLKRLFRPGKESSGEDNGQVTIIGGSSLFHGAPILALKGASRIVDMVFFASPEPSIGRIAEQIKSELASFIWVPWEEVGEYIEKSDAVLIGPGFMRFSSEKVPHGERHHECDEACELTTDITEKLLKEYPHKKWVIDAGSLQVMEPDWIPEGAIVTPNKKEYELLFGDMDTQEAAEKYGCTIVRKGPKTLVCDKDDCVQISNGNAGLTKGGTGDTLAGLTVALYAKNDAMLSASAASFLVKAAADELYEKVGTNYNADDLVDILPETFKKLTF
jgi:NAD(P)H-hydrate epimerase